MTFPDIKSVKKDQLFQTWHLRERTEFTGILLIKQSTLCYLYYQTNFKLLDLILILHSWLISSWTALATQDMVSKERWLVCYNICWRMFQYAALIRVNKGILFLAAADVEAYLVEWGLKIDQYLHCIIHLSATVSRRLDLCLCEVLSGSKIVS